MADFPSKVTTETSTQNSQNTQPAGSGIRGVTSSVSNRVDISFIRSIPGILMAVEIVLGFLQWMLIACAPHAANAAYGWVLFVAITVWILTIALFVILLFSFQRQLAFIPWPMTVMVYNGVAAVLFLTAFIANAATVSNFQYSSFFGHFASAAFFGAVMTLLYGASAFFSFLDWRGDGGNAATATVPT